MPVSVVRSPRAIKILSLGTMIMKSLLETAGFFMCQFYLLTWVLL